MSALTKKTHGISYIIPHGKFPKGFWPTGNPSHGKISRSINFPWGMLPVGNASYGEYFPRDFGSRGTLPMGTTSHGNSLFGDGFLRETLRMGICCVGIFSLHHILFCPPEYEVGKWLHHPYNGTHSAMVKLGMYINTVCSYHHCKPFIDPIRPCRCRALAAEEHTWPYIFPSLKIVLCYSMHHENILVLTSIVLGVWVAQYRSSLQLAEMNSLVLIWSFFQCVAQSNYFDPILCSERYSPCTC